MFKILLGSVLCSSLSCRSLFSAVSAATCLLSAVLHICSPPLLLCTPCSGFSPSVQRGHRFYSMDIRKFTTVYILLRALVRWHLLHVSLRIVRWYVPQDPAQRCSVVHSRPGRSHLPPCSRCSGTRRHDTTTENCIQWPRIRCSGHTVPRRCHLDH